MSDLDRMFRELGAAGEAFDKAMTAIGDGTSPEALKLTTPHDAADVEAFAARVVEKAKESSAAAAKEALAFALSIAKAAAKAV